jgi:glycosyltransferase involved in cell wall biosynthesis
MTTRYNSLVTGKVVILQYRLLHYRVRLFELLRERCKEQGIQLHLVHGQATRQEARKQDTGCIAWADVVVNRYLDLGGKDVLWQPFPSHHRDANLVVTMQENRLLSNYPWLFGWRGGHTRVAYWGHGRNFQSDRPGGLRDTWKKMLVGRVDWWFAYTEMTRTILLADGYPDQRITVLNNTIDNQEFERDLAAVSPARVQVLRQELDADDNAAVGLCCGSLYPDKRLDYMIAAADLIHAALPDFRLVVIGDGPSAGIIQDGAQTRPWIKWLGVRKGAEKAAWFKLADLVINPGLVGLHVLDSFCSGTPLITTREARHSPEIAYLQHGVNGLMVSGNAAAYADAVIALLRDRSKLEAFRLEALKDARRYTLDDMVNRFSTGIERCLSMQRKS